MVFLVCPRFPIYERIANSMVAADRKIGAIWIADMAQDTYKELVALNWTSLLQMLGQTISKTSILVEPI